MAECSCEMVQKIADEMVSQIREMLQELPHSQSGAKRKKRAPSAYNMFIKECTKEGRSDMKSCAVGYKNLSSQEKEKYKEMAARTS